jgi:transcriptional regulator with XRE-family HTH domain
MTPSTLRTWRSERGLSQSALAAKLGVSRPTIARWEAGSYPIPQQTALALETLVALNPLCPHCGAKLPGPLPA